MSVFLPFQMCLWISCGKGRRGASIIENFPCTGDCRAALKMVALNHPGALGTADFPPEQGSNVGFLLGRSESLLAPSPLLCSATGLIKVQEISEFNISSWVSYFLKKKKKQTPNLGMHCYLREFTVLLQWTLWLSL